MFSMLCWQNPADAGYTSFTDGDEYNIPHLGHWRHQSTYFQSDSGRGRATRVFKVVQHDGSSLKEVVHGEPTVTLTRTGIPDKDEPVVNEKADESEHVIVGTKRKHTTSTGSKPTNAPRAFKSLKAHSSDSTDSPSGSRVASPADEPETVPSIHSKSVTMEDFSSKDTWINETQVAHRVPDCAEYVMKVSCPEITKEPLMPPTPPTKLQFIQEQVHEYVYGPNKGFTSFGLADYVGAFIPCFPENWVSSNSIFIPHHRNSSGTFEKFSLIKEHYWQIGNLREAPTYYDRRVLLVIVSRDQGELLVKCKSADDIARCMFSVMIGYWSALKRGWIQRDPSIGNALRLTQKRTDSLKRTLFPDAACEAQLAVFENVSQAASELVDHFRQYDSKTFALLLNVANPAVQREFEGLKADPLWLRYRILEEAERLQLADHCLGLQTDFDLAAKLDAYVAEGRELGPSVYGTAQFLSNTLLTVATDGGNPTGYLPSTMDDLRAHFYTMVWAVVTCEAIGKPTNKVQSVRTQLRGSHRHLGVWWVLRGHHDSKSPPIVTQVRPLLSRWSRSLDSLETKYETLLAEQTGPSLKATMELVLLEGILEFLLARSEERRVGKECRN